ncbi:VENN motif pre-toxin domain-containing protein [Photorhabdus tasmaniensis]
MLTTDPQTGKVDIATNTLAHAILGAVAAEVSGNHALSGAAGAASGELAAQVLIKQLYGKEAKVSELTEEQKQTISTLSTLAAGLAGGIAGDSSASAFTGAQAGKNATDNNALAIPVTPPPVAGTNTGEAVNEANQTIASALDKKLKEMGESIDKATQCSFGRVCSSDYVDGENQPNISKDLTDSEKAELGGSGTGTPGGHDPEDEQNARNNNHIGKWSVDELSNGAKYTDPASKKGDLTLAGRALQKHGSRPGSIFPEAKGNPSTINEQGQKIVDSILNDPNKTVIQSNTGRYGQVTDVISSSGRGLRYDAQGRLIGFLEPPK